MKLISCKNCGVLLDGDVVSFPHNFHHDDGSVNTEFGAWNGEDYVAKIDCPVCDYDITEEK